MRIQVAKLTDDERLYKADITTGDLKEIPVSYRANKKLKNKTSDVSTKSKELFDPKLPYRKAHKTAWDFLYYKTTPMEYKIAGYMAMNAKMYTNSLKPLSDELSLREIANIFGIGKDAVKRVIDRLFELGVYGKFEVCEDCEERLQPSKYWICNPYLAIENEGVDKSLEEMFAGTPIAKACLMTKEK